MKSCLAENAPETDVGQRSELIVQFQSALETEITAASSADEKACIRSVRGVILANLRGSTLRASGAPVSTREVLVHETDALSKRLAVVVTGGDD